MNLRRNLMVGLVAVSALAGCAAVPEPALQASDAALSSPDAVVSAAALLVAAEAAEGARERAPLIARLDALGVAALSDTSGNAGANAEEDRLAEWRREYHPSADEVWRGRTLGPGYRRAQLAAGQRVVIDQIFYAGERAEMAAQTRSGQQVELAVTGRQAQKVCEAQLAPNARCGWLPIFTERFSITLTNRGTTPASVYLVFD